MDYKMKRLRRKAVIFLSISIFVFVVALTLFQLNRESPADMLNLMSLGFWVMGNILLAQSKGYSQWYGALGLLCVVGTAVLCVLPDIWPDEPPPTSPTNYPREPQP